MQGKEMRKGEQTRQRVIEAAARVMNQHGYNGSGMSELMRETGLAKGGLYRHFDSKQALAVEAFQFAFTTNHNLRFAHLDQVPNAVDKLQKFLENYADIPSPIPGGCPILNTGTENDDGNPALLQSAQQAFDATVKRLAGIIRVGRDRGEIRSEIIPHDLALFLFCGLEGGIFASRLQGSRQRLKTVALQLRHYLETEVRVPPAPKRKRRAGALS
jgi:TetR/AcrR family transcriptional repressor of nem operon